MTPKQIRRRTVKPAKSLVVHYHPRRDSLGQAATDRVLGGLSQAGHAVRILNLAEDFDPVMSQQEWQIYSEPRPEPQLHTHFEALRWATRLILVYPTWYGGQPAPLKGWFDRVWIRGVAWDLPAGGARLRPRLTNIKKIEIVTTHGSSRLINFVQGNPGRITAFRTLRLVCHPLCRTRWTALYKLDEQTPETIAAWLDRVEKRYSQ